MTPGMCLRHSPTEGKAATAQGGPGSGFRGESQMTLLNRSLTPKGTVFADVHLPGGLF